MPISGTQSALVYPLYYYAINGPWIDPTCQEDLEELLTPIRSTVRNMTVVYDPPDDNQASIDWRIIRDELLPEAQDWVDGQLAHKYATPFPLTKRGPINSRYDAIIASLHEIDAFKIDEFGYIIPTDELENSINSRFSGELGITKYDSQIVTLAAYYVGHRIESRTYSGSAMPNDSPYAQALLEQRDIKLQDLKTGVRIRGVRLKARNRFCDPHIETYDPPGQGATAGKGNFQPDQATNG